MYFFFSFGLLVMVLLQPLAIAKTLDCGAAPELITTFCEVREAIKKDVEPFFIGYFPDIKDFQRRDSIAEDAAKAAMAVHCLSKKDAAVYAKALVPVLLKKYVMDKVIDETIHELNRWSMYQKLSKDPIYVRDIAKKAVADDIDRQIKNSKKLDSYLISDHVSNVVDALQKDHKIQKELQEQAEKQQKQQAKKDIYEIYPEFATQTADGLKRNGTFFSDAEKARRQSLRDAECPVCYDEFQAVGKRVNLYCGHSVCPTCLTGQLHIHNATACPLCRAPISKQEFALSVLRKHIDCKKLMEAHKNLSAQAKSDCGCR